MIRLVTYADHRMTQSMELCCSSAKKHGVDVCWPQNPDTISIEFKEMNRDIWKEGNRGADCFWLFKPYVIYKAMLSCADGDILVYADAGVEFVNSVKHIIDRMDENIFFFTNGFSHVEWCKGDVINAINPSIFKHAAFAFDAPKVFLQVQASVIFFKITPETIAFVKQWLLYCQMPGLIDDSPSILPNYPTFAEHRHDQAIITSLQIKHGYSLHFWPTNYSEHIRHTAQMSDNYPTIFNHHRKRNDELC